MREYAILTKTGSILNVVTTSGPMQEVVDMWPDNEVKPLELVPRQILEGYQYWNERPGY